MMQGHVYVYGRLVFCKRCANLDDHEIVVFCTNYANRLPGELLMFIFTILLDLIAVYGAASVLVLVVKVVC